MAKQGDTRPVFTEPNDLVLQAYYGSWCDIASIKTPDDLDWACLLVEYSATAYRIVRKHMGVTVAYPKE